MGTITFRSPAKGLNFKCSARLTDSRGNIIFYAKIGPYDVFRSPQDLLHQSSARSTVGAISSLEMHGK